MLWCHFFVRVTSIIQIRWFYNMWRRFFQANIICPFYRGDASTNNETERYVVYNVTKAEFESCRLNANVENEIMSTPKIVALCDRPFKPNYFTLTFRPFSPTPGAFEFQPGNDYYFMSTSSQRNLYQVLILISLMINKIIFRNRN